LAAPSRRPRAPAAVFGASLGAAFGVAFGVALLTCSPSPPLAAGDPAPGCPRCAQAQATNGWCERHSVGWVGPIVIRSRVLHETLDAHGHEVDPASFHCPSCRAALDADGYCEEHRIGFVDGLAYFSRLSYVLARGGSADPAKIDCPTCRANALGHGWCDVCGVGRVGRAVIRDRETFDKVEAEVRLIEAANEVAKRCQRCALALLADARCPVCNIRYENGRALSPAVPRHDGS